MSSKKGRTQSSIPTKYQLHWPSHSVHCRRTQLRWILTLFGYFGFHLDQTTHYLQNFTGSIPTKTSTFTGTATIIFLPSVVFPKPLHIEQGLFVQTNSYEKGRGAQKGALQRYKFPNWFLTRLKIKSYHEFTTTQVNKNKNICNVIKLKTLLDLIQHIQSLHFLMHFTNKKICNVAYKFHRY